MQKDEIIVLEIMKGECYRFLAACFYLPNKESLAAEQLLANLTQNLQQICPAAAPFSKKMEESFEAYTEEELAVEYSRLFVGPFGLKAPPYGSIYLDNERTVMGPSTMETIHFYEKEGLARDESFNELPDHIAVELEFMYFLIFREAEALQNGESGRAELYRQKQENFRSRFLDKWVPAFCGNMKEGTDNVFYLALADCLFTLISLASVPAASGQP
ncbi:MAG: molecular chaperone TorD family protein [Desulfuromonadales bacterium]